MPVGMVQSPAISGGTATGSGASPRCNAMTSQAERRVVPVGPQFLIDLARVGVVAELLRG
ncbi:hypothetical protein [Paracoccus sp. (in: a-proteobacteria)]|uniref:hypothetical protein n=1 Tax=Paracoccus sp. TaxID=267 RepID=UPI002D80A330|nr:hypothetical protein [Paracoccus sp. (in: a-proteobacteria)]